LLPLHQYKTNKQQQQQQQHRDFFYQRDNSGPRELETGFEKL